MVSPDRPRVLCFLQALLNDLRSPFAEFLLFFDGMDVVVRVGMYGNDVYSRKVVWMIFEGSSFPFLDKLKDWIRDRSSYYAYASNPSLPGLLHNPTPAAASCPSQLSLQNHLHVR